jgi:hypothetical protein
MPVIAYITEDKVVERIPHIGLPTELPTHPGCSFRR